MYIETEGTPEKTPIERENLTEREREIEDQAWEKQRRHKWGGNSTSDNNENKREQPRTKRTPRQKGEDMRRGEAISLKLEEGLTFAEAVGRMKKKAAGEPSGVKKMRRAMNGDLIVEFVSGTDSQPLFNLLKGHMGEDGIVKRLLPKRDVKVLDVDPTVEEEELVETLAKQMEIDHTEMKVKNFRITTIGLKRALVECPIKGIDKLSNTGKIKIGWTQCRIKILPGITRCYRCHEPRHLARNCKIPDTSGEICRRCGTGGHKMQNCQNPVKCILCTRRGKTEGTNHIAGSYRCPVYGGTGSGIAVKNTINVE